MPNTTLPSRVAAEVRAEMARQQINQGELAERLGISRHLLRRRLSGEIPFDLAELEGICKVLNLPLSKLICPGDGETKARRAG